MVLQPLKHTDVQVPPLVQMAIACVVVLHGRNNKKENPQFSAQVPQALAARKKNSTSRPQLGTINGGERWLSPKAVRVESFFMDFKCK